MKPIYALLVLISLFATACQDMRQEVEPESLTQVEKKLVLIGFISPQDTIIAVKVGVTRPIADANYTSNYGTVKNAIVTLSTGGQSIQLTYNGKNDCYQADPKKFPIRAGAAYQLTAQTPEGMNASGSCTIPQATRLQQVRLDSSEDANSEKHYFVRYFWQDAAKTSNYYQTNGLFVYTKSCPTCKTDANAKVKSENQPILFESMGQLNTLLSDKAKDGDKLESYHGYLDQGTVSQASTQKLTFSTRYDRATVRATLLNVDEAYYKYHQALELQKKAEGNPFAEPVLLPSTITGGLGCFAGYNQSSLTLTLK
ncbi:DUF4249 domain-containing protein [Larkinella insperata]|uniref:DUF4249 domain-containing protein n=1 Tax=Larkinella insperata TaxID=332158 RepID=A0ABW3QDZ4_9BACT|nr:DUF4249 domain-containing protein [Larkinella insperata]